jgi:hypothetical protein
MRITKGEERFRKFIGQVHNAKSDLNILMAGHELVDSYMGFNYQHIADSTERIIHKMVGPDYMLTGQLKHYDNVNDIPYGVYLEEHTNKLFLVPFNREGEDRTLVDIANPNNTYSQFCYRNLYAIPKNEMKKYFAKYLVV